MDGTPETLAARMRPALDDLDQLVAPLNDAEQRVAEALSRLDGGWTVFVQPRVGLDQPDFIAVHDRFGVCAIEVRAWEPGAVRRNEYCEFELLHDGEWHRSSEQPRFNASRYRSTIFDQFFAMPEDGGSPPPEIRSMFVAPNFTTAEIVELMGDCVVHDDEELVDVFGGEVLLDMSDAVTGAECDPPRQTSMQRIRAHVVPSERVAVPECEAAPVSAGVIGMAINPTGAPIRRVRGAAGSGKTFGLTARAAQLAAQSQRVLVLSFNVTLANRLQGMVTDRCREIGANPTLVTACNFHTLCTRIVQDAEVAGYSMVAPPGAPWTVAIVAKAQQAFEQGFVRTYDAILVDEGQDFRSSWWRLLRDRMLTDGGEMLVVSDPTQDLYDRSSWTDAEFTHASGGPTDVESSDHRTRDVDGAAATEVEREEVDAPSDADADVEASDDAAADDGVADDGVTDDAAADDAVADDGVTDDAAADEAVTHDAVADDAAVDEAVTDDAAADDAAVDEAVTDDAAADDAVTDDAAADEAVTDDRFTDDAAVDEAIAGDASTDDAAGDDAVVDSEFESIVEEWVELDGGYRVPSDLSDFVNDLAIRSAVAERLCVEPANDHAAITGDRAMTSKRSWKNVERVNDLGRAIGREVVRLLQENPSLSPSDVAFLCEYHHDGVAAVRVIERAGYPVHHIFSRDPDAPRRRRKHRFWPGSNAVKGCTIHSFKGWETPALVVGIGTDKRAERAAFVAITRTVAPADGRQAIVSIVNANRGLQSLQNEFASEPGPTDTNTEDAPPESAVAPAFAVASTVRAVATGGYIAPVAKGSAAPEPVPTEPLTPFATPPTTAPAAFAPPPPPTGRVANQPPPPPGFGTSVAVAEAPALPAAPSDDELVD